MRPVAQSRTLKQRLEIFKGEKSQKSWEFKFVFQNIQITWIVKKRNPSCNHVQILPISLKTSRWHETFITTQISESLFSSPKHQRPWFQPITDKLLCFPTLLINSPLFWRLMTGYSALTGTLLPQSQWAVPSAVMVGSRTTSCPLRTSSFTWHASGVYFIPGIPTSPAARLFLVF